MLTTRRLWLAGAIALLTSAASAQTFVRKIPDQPALAYATDVAVDSAGNLWVVTDLDQVVKLSATGEELLRFGGQFRAGSGPTTISRPFSVAVGSSDDIYVSSGSYYILRFDREGEFLGWFGGLGSGNGQFQGVGKITTAPNGDVLAVDIANHRVQRFDAQGNFLLAFGGPGSGLGQFDFVYEYVGGSQPLNSTGITVDAAGDVYVVDRGNSRIQRFDAAGTPLLAFPASFPGTGFGTTHNDLVVDGQGRLLLVSNGAPIQAFSTSGQLLQSTTLPFLNGTGHNPTGLGVDGQGGVYMADYLGRMLHLSASLAITGAIGNGPDGQNDGRFVQVRGVFFDGNGDLIVADNTARMQRFDTAGTFLGKSTLSFSGTGYFVAGPVARDAAGFLYTSTYYSGTYTLRKFTAAGAWVQDITSFTYTPTGLAVDAAGNIYVGGGLAVRKFSPSGALLMTIPSSGSLGITVAGDGRILVTEPNSNRVTIHGAAGNPSGSLAVLAPVSIAVDPDGRIFVGTSSFGVSVFSASGARLATFGARGGGDGELHACQSMALRGGVLAVADYGNHRVQLFDVTTLDQQVPVVTIVSPTVTNPGDGAVITTNTFQLTAEIMDSSPSTVTSSGIGGSGLFALLPAGGGTASATMTWPALYDGVANLSVNARDTSGNTGGTAVRVTRDTTPPTLTCTLADGTTVSTSTISFSVSVYDLTSKSLTVSHGGGQYFQAGTGAYSFLSPSVTVTLQNGANLIELVATDAAGHSTTITRAVTADLSAPIVEFVGLGGQEDPDCFGPGQSPLPLTVRVTDLSATTLSSVPVGAITGSLPAGGGTRAGSVSLAQGINTITASARDVYGRTGSAVATVLYDLTAPTVAFDAPAAGLVAKGTVHVALQAEDLFANGTPGCGVATVAIALDGTLVDTLPSDGSGQYELDLDTAGLGDGPHTLSATATDGVGNSQTASVTFTLDNTAPQLAITAPAAGAFVSGNDLPFTATASDANGLVAVQMTVAGAAPNDTDGSMTWAAPAPIASVASVYDTLSLPDGALLLRVTARDAAGNEASAEVTVTVDNTAPERALVSPLDGATVTGVVPIVATASDPNLVSLVILVDGNVVGSTSASSLTVPFDTTARGEGPMTIEVVVTDAAGNVSRSTANVRVVNLIYDFDPDTLSLKNKGQGVVTAHIEGPTVANLLPVASHRIELRVNGGNTVSALSAGGVGDSDGDGVPDLTVRFDRATLISSVRAGILGGFLPADGLVDIELWVDGARVGASQVRVKS